MGIIKEYSFRDWTEFKSLFAERLQLDANPANVGKPLSRGDFLFRGQEDSDWHLETSFSRKFGGSPTGKYDPDQTYKALLGGFRRVCKPIKEDEIINLKEIIDIDYELAALGQHYGLPSQLLDWTESPYIAAFFAFRFALANLAKISYLQIRSETKNVAIWALDSTNNHYWQRVEEITTTPKTGGNEILVVRADPRHNDRLHSQLGWFTAPDKIYEPLDEHVQKFGPASTIVLWKFLIPLREVIHVMADLSLMGIDSTQMYGRHEGRALGALDNTIIRCLI
ncbi:MAG: FRG domain-containing protein [Methylococcales bacterium]